MIAAACRFPRLDHLQINLQDCYHLSGCHRLVESAFEVGREEDPEPVYDALRCLFAREATVDFLGTVSERERKRLVNTSNEIGITVGFQGMIKQTFDRDGSLVRAEWDSQPKLLDPLHDVTDFELEPNDPLRNNRIQVTIDGEVRESDDEEEEEEEGVGDDEEDESDENGGDYGGEGENGDGGDVHGA